MREPSPSRMRRKATPRRRNGLAWRSCRERIAQLAREAPEMAFTSLSHHIDINFLLEAYQRTRKGGVAGVDEQTAEDYAMDLEKNLQSLLDRFKSGTYWAPPVRRVHIPKGD